MPPPIPIANAGGDQFTVVGHLVTLDGTGSSSANGNTLSYKWNLTYIGPTSAATISAPDQPTASFIPDFPGTYRVSLIVNDGHQDSLIDFATITTISKQEAALRILNALILTINTIDQNHFRKPETRSKLLDNIDYAITWINQERYNNALIILRNNILDNVNGCKATGYPDDKDWITNCADQLIIYFDVISCIAYVEALPDINIKYKPDAAIQLALSTQIGTTLKPYIEYLHTDDFIAMIPFNSGGWGLTWFEDKYPGEADGIFCKFIDLHIFLNTNKADTEWLAFTIIHEVTHYYDYVLASKSNHPFNITNYGDFEIHAYANQYSFYQELKQRPEYKKNKLSTIVEKDRRSGSLELWKLCYEVGLDPVKKQNALAAIARFTGGTVEDLNKTTTILSCGP